mgnify:CR=1 FL=1
MLLFTFPNVEEAFLKGLGEKEAIVPSVSILVPSRNGHMTYAQFVNQCIRKLHLGNVEDYEFIAIVRNPWARMVSDYFYIGQTDPQNHGNGEVHRLINSGEWSFKDYVKEAVSRAESSNEGTTMWSYLIDADGKLAVEHIFKMETLNKDIEEFLLKVWIIKLTKRRLIHLSMNTIEATMMMNQEN